eukprot:gnl/TRDRNA2_/TRDRNA2_42979_c0_seq1.p1 gnl/TRDRNA2_/TRDRNA2_42979_c0~~gnl/TRDRNA2_/TRDRNA2_42979_c0_seq1.p1  ORF type:complete len:422 (+),score=111.17 gnl/TRDRNA2_/TRDRNA2_42979_c0_seq1:186-1268(+)
MGGAGGVGGMGNMVGMGSGGMGMGNMGIGNMGCGMGGSMGGMGSQESMSDSPTPWSGSGISMDDDKPAPIKAGGAKKGMSLGKKKPGDIFAGLGPAEPAQEAAVEKQEAPAAAPVNPLLEPVKVDIEEKITANLQVEGGLVGEAECQGQFQVTVLDANKAGLVCFKLAPQDQNFKYKVHPNLNKASQANNVLEVRDATRAFRANTPAPLVKWRLTSSKDEFLPINLSCWPSATADGTQIVLEFELSDESMTLENVHIRFPCMPNARPQVSSAEPGEASYDQSSQEVHWYIPVIDKSEGTGTLEFTASTDTASLLPYTFEAVNKGNTKCPMNILECYHQESKNGIDFNCEKSSTYVFTVGA